MNKQIEITITPTQQEKKMVELLAEGKKGNQIARELKLNENTLAFNLAEVRKKYGCRNSIQLVVLFFRNKLIN